MSNELQYGIEQPLRLYEKAQHQNQNRTNPFTAFKLYCPTTHILPFQIKRLAGIKDIQSIKIVDNVTKASTEIINNFATDELGKLSFEEFDYLIHYGLQPLSVAVAEGEKYLEITDDTTTWVSEVVTFMNFDPDNIAASSCIKSKIEYWDKYNVADIFYRTYEYTGIHYKNVIYLDIPIGRPDYEVELDGENDGDGVFVSDSITREKEHLLQGVYPEFMTDALTLLPLHKTRNGRVFITTEYGYRTEIQAVSVGKTDWIGGDGGDGRAAKLDILFTAIKRVKTNCASAIEPLTTCVRGASKYTALLLEGTTHYNNGTYVSLSENAVVDLKHKEIVAIEDANGFVFLREFDINNEGTPETMYNFISKIFTDGEVYTNSNLPLGATEPYLFWAGSTRGFRADPLLLNVGSTTSGGQTSLPSVRGKVITNSIVELYRVVDGGEDVLVGELKAELVNSSNGAVAGFILQGEKYYLKVIGLNCDLGISNEKTY